MARRKEIRRKDIPKQKPAAPVQTPKQAAEATRQRKDREARGQVPAGPGQEFVPPRKPLTAEVKRVGTREEVIGLEDRPGKEPTQILPEPQEPLTGTQLFESPPGGLRDKLKEEITKEQILKASALGFTLAAFSVAGAGVGLASSAGLTGAPTALSASGKLTSQMITERISLGGGRVLVNTYNAGKITSYLGRLVQAAKQPHVVLALIATGLYTSFFWGPNEKGDAMTTYRIAQGAAEKAEDWETVLEIDEAIQEANKIQANIPLIGFGQSERAKFESNVKSSGYSADRAREAIAESAAVSAEAEAAEAPPPPSE